MTKNYETSMNKRNKWIQSPENAKTYSTNGQKKKTKKFAKFNCNTFVVFITRIETCICDASINALLIENFDSNDIIIIINYELQSFIL